MKSKLIILIASVLLFAGCEDLLSPADENLRTLEDIYNDAAFAEGLMFACPQEAIRLTMWLPTMPFRTTRTTTTC